MRRNEWTSDDAGSERHRTGADIAREIEEELAFHLETSARDLASGGATEDEAEREALRRFGDVQSIKARCWRIDMENQIMMQRIHIAVTVVLVLAVGTLAALLFSAWRDASSSATQLEVQTTTTRALQEQLQAQTNSARALEEQLQVQSASTRALQEQLMSQRAGGAQNSAADNGNPPRDM